MKSTTLFHKAKDSSLYCWCVLFHLKMVAQQRSFQFSSLANWFSFGYLGDIFKTCQKLWDTNGLNLLGSTFINVEFVVGRMCYVKFIDIVFDSWLFKKEGFIIQMRWIHSGWIDKESQLQVFSGIFVQNFTSVVPFV